MVCQVKTTLDIEDSVMQQLRRAALARFGDVCARGRE